MSKPQHGDRRPCRGCGKPITFMLDEKGTLQVLDSMAPIYKIELDLTGEERAVLIENAYISHFRTCPKADEFSASKRGAASKSN